MCEILKIISGSFDRLVGLVGGDSGYKDISHGRVNPEMIDRDLREISNLKCRLPRSDKGLHW